MQKMSILRFLLKVKVNLICSDRFCFTMDKFFLVLFEYFQLLKQWTIFLFILLSIVKVITNNIQIIDTIVLKYLTIP